MQRQERWWRGPVVPSNSGGAMPSSSARTHGRCLAAPARRLFPTLWRIDKNTLANNAVHCLPVDVGPNHFEFELVISGQRVAGLHRQQLGPSLNIKRCMSGTVNIGVPHFDAGL